MERSDGGVEFDKLPKNISVTVSGLLSAVQRLAEREQLGGLVGTGLMLTAIYQTGQDSPDDTAPTVLARLIKESAHTGFKNASEEFLKREHMERSESWQPSGTRYTSKRLLLVFADAETLPRPDDILAARHLIVALLHRPGSGARKLLAAAGVDWRSLLAEFVRGLKENEELGIGERMGWGELLLSSRILRWRKCLIRYSRKLRRGCRDLTPTYRAGAQPMIASTWTQQYLQWPI